MHKINLHVYPTVFKYESRILKETETLGSSSIFDRIIIAVLRKTKFGVEEIDKDRNVMYLPVYVDPQSASALAKLFIFFIFYFKLYFHFHNTKVSCINCHSVSVLPICVLLKWSNRCKLVYDPHELETETISSRGLRKKMVKLVEKKLIPFADAVIVVSGSIAEWYKNTYQLKNVFVVRNVPKKPNAVTTPSDDLKARLHMRHDSILFLYNGMLSEGRGIELLLKIFSSLITPDKHIVFLGYGPLEQNVRSYSENYQNIHYCSAVSPEKVIDFIRRADVGLSIIENVCLSYKYCLPNKLFEYLLSGIPVIVSNFPDMVEIVEKYNCGWRVDVSEISIAALINSITYSEIQGKQKHLRSCPVPINWEAESSKLLDVYASI
ncbi:Glycosyl transferase, group 1 family protein [Gammaproteobacteria bacterium]